MKLLSPLALLATMSFCGVAAQADNTLKLENVFDLEYANQIEMTNDGKTVYFVRNRMDIKSKVKSF